MPYLENITISDAEMQRIVGEVIDRFLIPKFRSYQMNATGEWLRTIEARGNQIWGREYTEQLVYGRKGGTMPPVSAILEWVYAKFGLSGQQAESAAWAIATKIKQEGTTWYKKGGTDLLNVLESQEVINFMNTEIQRVLTNEVRNRLVSETKLAFKN